MKTSKEYRKMWKKHLKELKFIGASSLSWDYGPILAFIVEYLKFMQEYYRLGENVWGIEDCEINTRLTTINDALREYELYESCFENYFKIIETTGASHNNAISAIDNFSLIPIKNNNLIDVKIEYIKEEQQHWNNFWNIIKDNIRKWWD